MGCYVDVDADMFLYVDFFSMWILFLIWAGSFAKKGQNIYKKEKGTLWGGKKSPLEDGLSDAEKLRL